LAAGLLLAACSNPISVRGQIPDTERVEAIKAGVHGRQDVFELLGTPSTISTFEDRKWYYIGQKSIEVAFKKPEILERSVLVVSFDGSGRVDDKVLYTLDDGREIDPVDRITPTEGRELTIMQQLLGNLGRLPGPSQGREPDIP
jgi:outer membrane protein assembly factor BamE (lipoprotein component of BamABCDE complex)